MQKTQTICLVTLTVIAVTFSLYYLQTVLLPLIISVFIVIGCRPILEYIKKRLKLHTFVAFVVTFLCGVSLLAAFGLLVSASVYDLSRTSADYEQRVNSIAIWITDHFFDEPEEISGPMPQHNPEEEAAGLAEGFVVSDIDSGGTLADEASKAVHDLTAWFSTYLKSVMLQLVGSLSMLLSYGVLILIFVFFLLLGNSAVKPVEAPRLLVQIEEQVRKYLVMKTIISFFTGLLFGMVLWFFGVPLAIVFGLLAFLLNFIPNIGPLIASVLPVPFLVLNSEIPPATAITCFVLISAIQFVSGNVIETKLMGKSFDVNPVFLLMALMFFGLIWGIVGMFLATPIVSCIKIVLNQSKAGRPFADLMAGRWTFKDLGDAPPV